VERKHFPAQQADDGRDLFDLGDILAEAYLEWRDRRKEPLLSRLAVIDLMAGASPSGAPAVLISTNIPGRYSSVGG